MVDSVTLLDMLLMIGDAVTGRVPRFPESVTQIIFEAVEFSLPFELKGMIVNLPGDLLIIAGMKLGFFFESNAFLAGCGFETQPRTKFNPGMGIAGLIASPRGVLKSAGLLEDQPGALRVARAHPQGVAALLVGAERAVPLVAERRRVLLQPDRLIRRRRQRLR